MILMLLAAALAGSAPDYADPAAWLCRPGRADACAANQDVTVIAADGHRKAAAFKPAVAPRFDCFYVYPTVSRDAGVNSDLIAGNEERTVAAVQAARFTSRCRVFAPLYRQVTLTELGRARASGSPVTGRALAYADVKAAWDHYLATDNRGRGVILIGHSQGSGMLKALLADEIAGKPVQRLLIAAYLAGTNLVASELPMVPRCTNGDQTGCVVAWVSFHAERPPQPGGPFGSAGGAPAQCVNPAALVRDLPAGEKTVSHPIFTAAGAGLLSKPNGPWTSDGAPVATTFVATPGLVAVQCRGDAGVGYLAVSVAADPADPRTDTIGGDIVLGGQVLEDWGLHLLDMPVVMGDLVDLAGRQGAAWGHEKWARPAMLDWKPEPFVPR